MLGRPIWRRRNHHQAFCPFSTYLLGTVPNFTPQSQSNLHQHHHAVLHFSTVLSARQRRLQVLKARQKEKKKALAKTMIEEEEVGEDELGVFFDTFAPKIHLDKVEDLTFALNSRENQELAKFLKNMAKKRDQFRKRLSNLILPFSNKTQRYRPVKPSVQLSDLVDVLIAAKDRAIVQGMGWETYMKYDQPPVESPDDVKQAAAAVAEHMMQSLPDHSIDALSRLFTSYSTDGESIQTLGRHIAPITLGHFHFVAVELAHFFPCPDADVAPTLANYKQSWKRWYEVREAFIRCILKVQEKLQSVPDPPAPPELVDLDNPKRTPTKVISKKKKKRHVCFEIISITEEADDLSPTSLRTVLIDNLPITVTKERLRELYSRCGHLDEIEIFQLRPDLDPGPLSATERSKRRKERFHRLDGDHGWTRPRTPVYALLTFADEAGYNRAVNQSLQLFGMLIDRHSARSVPAKTLTSLYIDDIDIKITTLETSLGRIMDKYWAVCLAAGQSNRGFAQSCEIKFPSYQSACTARSLLHENYNINWIETPRNAMDWWTRDLSFD